MTVAATEGAQKKPRKSKDTGDKRDRILRAAIRVFARKGFYATRVSEIAKAAGVADGTIYLYFKNKDDVLISLFEDRLGRLINELRAQVSGDGTVLERLQRVIAIQLGQLEGRRDLAEVVTVNLRQSTKLMKQYAIPLFNQYIDVMAGLVAEGQQNGELRTDLEPLIVARAIWGSLDGVLLPWAMTDAEPASLRRAANDVAQVYIEGLRKR
jgi:TetR/AcrR family fatty acid metabolism transcriptional regulator